MAIKSTSKLLNIYKVANAMTLAGWRVVATPLNPTLHFCVQQTNIPMIPDYIESLKKSAALVKEEGCKYDQGPFTIYETVNSWPSSITEKSSKICLHELCKLNNFTASK